MCFICVYLVGIWVDDVKVFIVVSGLRIIVCDDFEEVVEMVRVFILNIKRRVLFYNDFIEFCDIVIGNCNL